MLRICSPNAALISPKRRCAVGRLSSVAPTQARSAGLVRDRRIGGIWTRSSSGSAATSTISGAQSTTRAKSSTSSSSRVATGRRPSSSCGTCEAAEIRADAIVTDRLTSYGAALRDLGLAGRHVTGGRSNNRAEISHQPTRRRERQRRGFRSPGSAQQFLAIHAAVYNQFNIQRHLISRRTLKALRAEAFAGWRRWSRLEASTDRFVSGPLR